MQAFWLSLGIVFLAELGDKTQLVALCLASRFRARVVLSGILIATLAVHILSVLLGGGVGKALPEGWVKLVSGLAFLGFGFWTLRGDSLSAAECDRIQGRSPLWLVITTFFVAELGDKTMLSTVALATDHAIIPVWLGSSLGMVVSDGLAIGVGALLGAKLPERVVKSGAAFIFFGFGLYNAITGALRLPSFAWWILAVVAAAFSALFLRGQRRAQAARASAGIESQVSDLAAP